MKKVQNCEVENCIPTPTSCNIWNGGTIEYLGICDGDSMNTLVWEVVTKLQQLAGEDLSKFDIDSLVDICNKKAPTELTILSILNVVKDNQICLKDFIDGLSEQIANLSSTNSVSVNLKCYAQFDNLGNSLSITRAQLDQLVIDNLCAQKERIETLEGKVISLQSQIDNINVTNTVDELSFPTCVNTNSLPTSTQVINTSQAICDLTDATGDDTAIASALAKTPGTLNAEFGLISGWILAPSNWAQNYNNLLLEVENLRQRIKTIESTCCAASCDDVKLGFSAVYNEDNTGIILKFTAGAGTSIPSGFLDIGSTITITDIDGNVETYTTANPNLIANNAEIEINVVSLNLNGELIVSVTANISNGSLTCSKCLGKTVKQSGCNYCEITATGADGSSAVIVYEGTTSSVVIEASSTTTSSSTTTTTTLGV